MKRLGRVIAQNWKDTDWFRRNRRMIVEELPGIHYGVRGAEYEVPDNLLQFQETVLLAQLVPGTLRTQVRPVDNQSLKLSGTRLRLRMNRLFNEINLTETVGEAIQDSLNSIGICKTGMSPSHEIELGSHKLGMAGIFVEIVDPDDLIYDNTVRKWKDCAYIGNRYRVSVASLEADERNDQEAVSMAKGNGIKDEQDDSRAMREAMGLTRGSQLSEAELEPHIDVYDIWLTKERILITVAAGDPGEQSTIAEVPLRVSRGPYPPGGPYDLLWYHRVSGNLMAQSPMAILYDLHKLSNVLYRKASDQAERQKTILGVLRKALEDGERIVDTSDGEAIPLDDPKASQEYRFGGVDPGLQAFYIQTAQLFNRRGGNLDLLGGVAAQSDTLGQDEILNSNAGSKVRAMQTRVQGFIRSIMEKIGWYMWLKIDEFTTVEKPIQGTTGSLPLRYSPAHLEGTPADYEFEVEPYSAQPRTPGQRFAAKAQIFQTVYMPNQQIAIAQGKVPNMQYIMEDAAESMDAPEFERWFMTGSQPGLGGMEVSGSEPSKQPYVPTNRFGGGKGAGQQKSPEAETMTALAAMTRDNRSRGAA